MRDKEVIAGTRACRLAEWMSHRLKTRAALPLLLLTLTVGGCGSASHKIVFSKPVNEQIAANEFARLVNLRLEDLPGMESVGQEEEDTGIHATIGLGGCRVRHQPGVRSFYSPRFLSQSVGSLSSQLSRGRSVGSAVVVFPGEARPTADRMRYPVLRDCLQREDDTRGRFSEEHLEPLTRLPAPLASVKSFGSRATIVDVLRGPLLPGRRFTEYEDVLGFLLGRSEVVELADSRGAPFPAKKEHQLLALLYSRAKQAKAP